MKKVLYISIAFIVTAVASFISTFLPNDISISSVKKYRLPVVYIPEGIRIRAIKTGEISSVAAFAFRGGSFFDARTTFVGSILIEHPQGSLLIDAGLGKDVEKHKAKAMHWLMRNLSTLETGQTVREQLSAAGINLNKIKGVIPTHTHWDHTSGLEDLDPIPVLLPNAEVTYQSKKHSISSVAHEVILKNLKSYEFANIPYMGFEKSYDFYNDGSVIIVPAPGHTPGSVIIFVNTSQGKRYAFIGDLAWLNEGIQRPAERPWLSRYLVDDNPEKIRALLIRMHNIAKYNPELIIVPAHDATSWKQLPKL